MKMFTLVLFSVLFIPFISYSQISMADPNLKQLHPTPQGSIVRWIKVWNDSNWYAGGEMGMFMKTSDAGKNWIVTNEGGWPNYTFPEIKYHIIAFAHWFWDMNNGIVAGIGAGVCKTSDGGNTWDTIRITPNNGTIWDICFTDQNNGYLVGNANFKCMKTTDGGLTWKNLSNFPALIGYSVYASDSNKVLVFGQGHVYQSLDGGASWNDIYLNNSLIINASVFPNPDLGFICGNNGLFGYTTNGGNSWNTSFPTNSNFTAITYYNNEVYLVASDTLYKSTDLGQTWTKSCFTVPAQGQLYITTTYAIDKAASTLLMGGQYGAMFLSSDNGSSWKYLSKFVSYAPVYSLYVENKPNGKIIGQGYVTSVPSVPGTIISSDDGGLNWSRSSYISPLPITRSQFLDNLNGYVLGTGTQGSYFAKTHDGGLTFDTTNAYLVNSNGLACLHFLNAQTGWLAGGNDTVQYIAKTTDGGNTWENKATEDPEAIFQIAFFNENLGYAGGFEMHLNDQRSYLLKTTDGGDSWVRIFPPIPFPDGVQRLKIVDKYTLYVSSLQNLFRSNDAGNTWTEIPVPFPSGWIFNMDWKGDFGVLTGAWGYVIKTTNGGQDWTMFNTGGWGVFSVKIVNADTFYLGGGNGQIYRYANETITNISSEIQISTPETFALLQNYPNPFNPLTIISYAIPKDGYVSLKIYDVQGKEIKVLVSSEQKAGYYSIDFNARNLASGVYFYKLESGTYSSTKKLMLLK